MKILKLTLPIMLLFLTACAQQPVTPPFNIPEPNPNETLQVHGIPISYYLVKNLAEGEEVKGFHTGCYDGYLVAQDTNLIATDKKDAIAKALSELFKITPQQAVDKGLYSAWGLNNLKVDRVEVAADEKSAAIHLSGTPMLAGTCDAPRFKDQIQETIRLYVPTVVVTLNGKESEWRCLGDESGLCQ